MLYPKIEESNKIRAYDSPNLIIILLNPLGVITESGEVGGEWPWGDENFG